MTTNRGRPSVAQTQIEHRDREIAMLRADLASRRRDPGDLPVTGCGDNSCMVASPTGMATNGGCSCNERTLRLAMQYWRRLAVFREETIRDQRAADAGRYAFRLHWSAEDKEYVATCESFPSLSALDVDPGKALDEIQALVAAVVADMRKGGETLPASR